MNATDKPLLLSYDYLSQYNKFFITVLLLELLLLLTLICMKWIIVDPNTIFLMTGFTQKMSESSDYMYSFN